MKAMVVSVCALLAAFSSAVQADREAPNAQVVASSEAGRFYAKSVPDEPYGQKGITRVFSVDQDALICEYPWYARELHMGGSGDTTVVRFGPWHRGSKPSEKDLAVGIYCRGKTLREYSTLDMQNHGSGVSSSVSHYVVFGRRLGFRWLKGNACVYEVEGVSGKVFAFDLDTGAIVEKKPDPPPGPDGKGAALTQEQAVAAADALLKETKLDWGKPRMAETVPGGGWWLQYPTPEKEQFLMGLRTVLISPQGKASLPPRPDPSLVVKLILKKDTYTLDPAQSGPEFVRKLKELEKGVEMPPPPPAVDMSLELTNVGKDPVTIPLRGDETSLDLKLEGPGAVTVPYVRMLPRAMGQGTPTIIEPGKSLAITISRLQSGSRSESMACYWTAPGTYTLTASYTTPLTVRRVNGVPDDRAFTFAAAPVKVNVLAPAAALTQEQAVAAADALLKETKLDWGKPHKTERTKEGGWSIQYVTPEHEMYVLGVRTVIVSPEGKAWLLPRK
jgi:hypothetical protein